MFLSLCAGISILWGCQTKPYEKIEIDTRIILVNPEMSEDFAVAQVKSTEIFCKDLKVSLKITDVIVLPSMEEAYVDQVLNPNHLCIYYFPPNQQVAGISSFPWHEQSNYIMVYGTQLDKTMWHEFLHWCGLYHTHEDPTDFVEDTPVFIPSMAKYNPNVMAYNILTDDRQIVTPGQIERARYFLLNNRIWTFGRLK